MLTTIIKTKNNENTISETLESVKDLGEIFVIDEHSVDDTVLLAKEYKAKILYSSVAEFDIAFNQAVSELESEWILLLEGDEIIPQQLGNKILNYIENPKKNKHAIFLPLKLFYLDKEIRAYRNFKLRLFKKDNVELINKFSIDLKPLKTKTNKIIRSFKNDKNCILKFEKRNIFDIFQDISQKAIIKSKNNRSNSHSIFLKPFFNFLKLYIFKKSLLDGKKGFICCLIKAIEVFIIECNKLETIHNEEHQ